MLKYAKRKCKSSNIKRRRLLRGIKRKSRKFCLTILNEVKKEKKKSLKRIRKDISRNVEDTMELFKLTESQADFLSNKKRGYAIIIIGAYKILAKFEIYPYEFEYFGKSGGR